MKTCRNKIAHPAKDKYNEIDETSLIIKIFVKVSFLLLFIACYD